MGWKRPEMDWGNTRGGKTDRGKGLIWTVSVTNNTAHISFCVGAGGVEVYSA